MANHSKNAKPTSHLRAFDMLIFAQVWCAYACKTQSTVEKWPKFRKVTRILKKIAMSMCPPQISLYLGCGRHRSGGIYYYSWGVFCACSPAIALNCSGTPVSTDAPRWACLLGLPVAGSGSPGLKGCTLEMTKSQSLASSWGWKLYIKRHLHRRKCHGNDRILKHRNFSATLSWMSLDLASILVDSSCVWI